MKKIVVSCALLFLSVFVFCTGGYAVTEAPELVRTSEVTTSITTDPSGLYTYAYTVTNTSLAPQQGNVWPCIIGFDVPLDSPSVISNIQSPSTWSYEILSAQDYLNKFGISNPFDAAYVLHWYDAEFDSGTKMIVPDGFNATFSDNQYEDFVDGFSFTSDLTPVDGPYSTLWSDKFVFTGDPPLPGGSVTGGSLPYTPQTQVPEPATLLLLALGMAGVTAIRKR